MSITTHFFGSAERDVDELAHRVARRGAGLTEHHLADVARDVLVGVDRFGDRCGGRRKLQVAFGAVAVELDVRQVDRQAFRASDGRERRLDIRPARRGCSRECGADATTPSSFSPRASVTMMSRGVTP